MEFKVTSEDKHKITFELIGETHTFCNALKTELQQIKGVDIATYRINHPLLGVPQFQIETKSIEPRKAIKEALANLKKKAKEFEKEISNL